MAEPLAFLFCIAVGILAGWAILRLHEARQASKDAADFEAFQRHMAEVQGDKYLQADDRRPE